MRITVVGGGLAGSEAAWYLARMGFDVVLYEARPKWSSPAHRTDMLAELVCSNSLKSVEIERPTGLLKQELRELGSLLIPIAERNRVEAGVALAVDREAFSREATAALTSRVEVVREEVTDIPDPPAIIATGPLTSPSLSSAIARVIGQKSLFFYDAIAPVVAADTIDWDHAFEGSRWGKGAGYINCPLDREQYEALVRAILEADTVEPHPFEEEKYFESCLPIEVMARRGMDVLRHGPLRPVGLTDPRTGKEPYAVVQLRSENRFGTAYNLVGFQTRLKYPEQKRIIRMIPALHEAEILRYGEIHRNTYVDAPRNLRDGFALRDGVYLAGLLVGVEGYVESMAMGLLAAMKMAAELRGIEMPEPPVTTAMGGLYNYIRTAPEPYSPTNVNFGLWPPVEGRMPRKKRRQAAIARAREQFAAWLGRLRDAGLLPAP